MILVVNARFLTQKLTGVQRFAAEICKELKLIYPSVIFVSPSNIIQPELAIILNATIVGNNTGVLWEQWDLPLFLKAKGRYLLLNLGNTAPLLCKNQIVTIHDLSVFVNPKWFSKQFSLFYKFLIPKIVKRSRLVLSVSEFSKREIIKYLGTNESNIKIVYNSISKLPVKKDYYNEYGRYILIVGSIDKRKNIDILIKAFLQLDLGDVKLLVVGNVNKIFSAKSMDVTQNGSNVVALGYINDELLSCLYANALLFVYPSLYEGFGIPPIEAMSYGCATMVSDIGSLRETCGSASVYADPYSADDIAEKIKLVLNDKALRESLITEGYKNIQRFSWKASAAKIHSEIKQLK